MAFDWPPKFPSNLPTRDGPTQGKSFENRAIANVGGVDQIRKKIIDNPDGSQTIFNSRNGFPEFITTNKKRREFCVKSPLTETAFADRMWYGEVEGVVTTQKYQFSSDGILCLKARKQQKITLTDAYAQTVDFVLSEKPVDPDDATNPENQNYDGSNTLATAASAHAVAANASRRFRFAEGRYKYREWFANEVIAFGWAFTTPSVAVGFLCKRLKKLALLAWDTLVGGEATVQIEWTFTEDVSPDLTGEPTSVCANQSAREKSFAGRTFFATDGHMAELDMRVNFTESPSSKQIKLIFKPPGSFIAPIDPTTFVGTHPGYATAVDLVDFAAFGNPYHGYCENVNNAGAIFYKDDTKAVQWPFTSSAFSERSLYVNFNNVDPLLPANVIGYKIDDGLGGEIDADEKYYKDAVFHNGYWWGKFPGVNYWGYIDHFRESLYKDPAGTVWVIHVMMDSLNEQSPGYPNASGIVHRYQVLLSRRYGDLGEDMIYPGSVAAVTGRLKYLHDSGWIGSYYSTYVNYPATADRQVYNSIYLEGLVRHVSPNGKEIIVCIRDGWMAGDYLYADKITISGTGATVADPLNGVAIGDGISVAIQNFGLETSSVTTNTVKAAGTGLAYVNNPAEIITGTQSITCTTPDFYGPGQPLVITQDFNDTAKPRHVVGVTSSHAKTVRKTTAGLWHDGSAWVRVHREITSEVTSKTYYPPVGYVDYSRTYAAPYCAPPFGAYPYYTPAATPTVVDETAGTPVAPDQIMEYHARILHGAVEKSHAAIEIVGTLTGVNLTFTPTTWRDILNSGSAGATPLAAMTRPLGSLRNYIATTGEFAFDNWRDTAWVTGVFSNFTAGQAAVAQFEGVVAFRDGTAVATISQLSDTTDGSGAFVGNVCWAYDYRVKKLTLLPANTTAFYI